MLLLLLVCTVSFAAISNVKVLTDNTPDWTDQMSAANSMTANLGSDEQKAIALWKWIAPIRYQVSPARDDWSLANVPGGHPQYGVIYNPIKIANNYGNAFCVNSNSFPALLWKRLGNQARELDINGHTVCDLYYGGGWHNFDPAFGFYYKDASTKRILQCSELVSRGSSPTNIISDVTKVNIISIAANTNGCIYMDSDPEVILDREYSGISATRTTLFSETYCDNYTYKLHIKPYESYTRRWRQIADNSIYYLGASGGDGANPNNDSKHYNIMTNGIWEFRPALDNAKFLEAVASTANLAQGGTPRLHPASAGSNATFTYRVDGANIICHAVVSGTYTRASGSDVLQIQYSDNGSSWSTVHTASSTGTGSFNVTLSGARENEYYFLRFNMQAAGSATNCGLNTLRVTTYTIVNQRTIPSLRMGSNRIMFKHSGGAMEPVEVVYFYSECDRNGTTTPAQRKKSHKKTISASGTEWYVNVGGYRNPIMDSMRIAWAGTTPSHPEGYNNGQDPGPGLEAPRYYYTFGRNIAVNKTVTSAPAGANLTALTDGKAQLVGGWAANLNPEIVVDLGSSQQSGGIRLAQIGTDYLDSGVVSTSTDGSNYTRRGSFYYSQLWEPITNYAYSNTWDALPNNVARLSAGIAFHKFSCAYDNGPTSARYIKVKVYNSVQLAVQELEVYDQMSKTLVVNELAHGFTLPDLGIVADQKRVAALNTGRFTVSAEPNPFKKATVITVGGRPAVLKIFDIQGRLVRAFKEPSNVFTWDVSALPTGVYYASVTAGKAKAAHKLVLMR
jgi:hypothetical protein